jgi:hypothetical protein
MLPMNGVPRRSGWWSGTPWWGFALLFVFAVATGVGPIKSDLAAREWHLPRAGELRVAQGQFREGSHSWRAPYDFDEADGRTIVLYCFGGYIAVNTCADAAIMSHSPQATTIVYYDASDHHRGTNVLMEIKSKGRETLSFDAQLESLTREAAGKDRNYGHPNPINVAYAVGVFLLISFGAVRKFMDRTRTSRLQV